MSERIQIKRELLEWAQERSGISTDQLCEKFPKYPEWLAGHGGPTVKQLDRLAAQTFTPLGYFFLASPPDESLPFPDFRTVTDERVARPSPHLLDTIHGIQLRQAWMREFLIEREEDPLPFINSKTLNDAPLDVATAIRDTLELDAHWGRQFQTWEEALRKLIETIEGIGVLVMINGVVGNNTHRPLDVNEFRGFALSDDYAPVIFINGRDAKAAQMFTLVHELAHLWIGEGGLSGLAKMLPPDNKVEIFCNKVAAEFLVPGKEVRQAWRDAQNDPKPFDRLARTFKVSPVVAARCVLDLELITQARYFEFYRQYVADAEKRKGKKTGGGNFYRTLGSRLGKRFPAAVYVAAKEGRLAYRDAYQLTGLNGANYDRFGQKFGFAT